MILRYISDCHFKYEKVISFDNRPFKSSAEMIETIVKRWNETVSSKDDLTYVLGDFCGSYVYEEWAEILPRLNGRLFVVQGNHDSDEVLNRLLSNGLIVGWSRQEIVDDGGRNVVLNHTPMPFFINEFKDGWAHLYGHVHNSYDWRMVLGLQKQIQELYLNPVRMYNVGCMLPYMNYAPRTLDEIEAGFGETNLETYDFIKNHE